MPSWKKRYMVLEGRDVTYFDRDVRDPKAKEKGAFRLAKVQRNHDIARGMSLLNDEGKVMLVYTDTVAEFVDCFNAMNNAVLPPPAAAPLQRIMQSSPHLYPPPHAAQAARPTHSSPDLLSPPRAEARPSPPPPVAQPEAVRSTPPPRPSTTASAIPAVPSNAHSRPISLPPKAVIPSYTPSPPRPSSLTAAAPPPEPVDHSGWLEKQGEKVKSWKRRYFVLMGQYVAYFDKFQGGARKGGGRILDVLPASDRPHALQLLMDNNRVLIVAADTHADMQSWFRSISRAVGKAPPPAIVGAPPQLPAPQSTANYTGWLEKEGEKVKSWKRRYFELSGRRMAYFEKFQGEKPKGGGRIRDVQYSTDRPHAMLLKLESNRILHVAADTTEEIQGWYQAVCKGLGKPVGVAAVVATPVVASPAPRVVAASVRPKPTPMVAPSVPDAGHVSEEEDSHDDDDDVDDDDDDDEEEDDDDDDVYDEDMDDDEPTPSQVDPSTLPKHMYVCTAAKCHPSCRKKKGAPPLPKPKPHAPTTTRRLFDNVLGCTPDGCSRDCGHAVSKKEKRPASTVVGRRAAY
ncbi:Aste57867_644 [Aphanomyces stellatus]|uniref:Aste57867_644 protein n=1 Tax=Aphanomyces stellatus TaxID=120398 RepID=A0A485K8C9_9STRA|nr:hypothetical protein As57867_000643 [Aphanomyces stellatus]VFT77869.1 Aste57867_644 [Aphanomyces stellatus]